MTPKLASNVLLGLPVAEAITAAMAFLRAHGYAVFEADRSGHEFTIGELCFIFDLPHATLAKRLAHPLCPPSHRRLGPNGRMLSLVVTRELDAWLSQPRQPGRKLRAMEVQAA